MLPMRAYCKRQYEVATELFVGQWMRVKRNVKGGVVKPCICVDLVNAQEVGGFSDVLAGYMSGSLFEAGSETTASELIGFMQALVLFPEAQRKAQAELDRVIGPDRLPTMEDEFDLQYIRGCVKETMRWMSTAITSVPHAVTRDDWYEGYLIPKGAGVIANNWTIHMDPQRHANPRTFDPSRYANDFQTAREATSNPDVSKRDHFTFGTGRRVCQGMHIAERSLFLAMSRILWAFNVQPALNEDGEHLMPDPDNLTGGLMVHPQPFPAKITPRSEKHAAIIREQWAKCLPLLDEKLQWKEVPAGMKFSTYDAKKQVASEFD
ncbi:cytochrome P450 [Phlyctema vagabunda]|uniref:Cytochrome P450 n=1 Tax=Phlyctema vagabunda TaxID=108571 RepID=A0ABR4P701_9HELO